MVLFQITLGDVSGTGKDGRILKEDIMNYIEKMKSAPTAGKYAITMPSGLNLMWIGSPPILHSIIILPFIINVELALLVALR